MKSRTWIVGSAMMLALGMGTLTSSVTAQPAKSGGAKKAQGGKAKRPPIIPPMMLEKLLGKPLTPQQKQAVTKVVQKYHEDLAKAIGLTPVELQAKAKAYRQAHQKPKAKA